MGELGKELRFVAQCFNRICKNAGGVCVREEYYEGGVTGARIIEAIYGENGRILTCPNDENYERYKDSSDGPWHESCREKSSITSWYHCLKESIIPEENYWDD